jgi:hypothetical protein
MLCSFSGGADHAHAGEENNHDAPNSWTGNMALCSLWNGSQL